MDAYVCYVPVDRRKVLIEPQGDAPSESVLGAVLFADISGFTALTKALTRRYGVHRGADELVRQINRVYDALIEKIHDYGGSVIGFSGDAITCWFDASDVSEQSKGGSHGQIDLLQSAARRSFLSACAIQIAMGDLEIPQVEPGATISLAVKISIASGHARRYLVGDPSIQVVDVLAGRLLDQMAEGEQIAQDGETVLTEHAARLLADLLRNCVAPSKERLGGYVVLSSQQIQVAVGSVADAKSRAGVLPQAIPASTGTIPEERLRPWLLPAVYQRLRSSGNSGHDRYLAEMRPATALFVRFGGLDYDNNADAGMLLNQYICWAQGLLQRYGGSLIQITTGDKGSYFYATFGAPTAYEDDAARAAAAAVELLRLPAELSAIQDIQIGIAQGRMRVGAYGSSTRRTYGVIGDATNLSARLMMHAEPGEILISGDVVEEIGQRYQLADRGLVHFKGKEQPQQVYSVQQRGQARATQFKTLYTEPLVGRDGELAQIDKVIAAVFETEVGHILRIEGDAGVGKSHLAAVTTERADEHDLAMVLGACQSTGRDSAYAPLRQIVRQLFNLPPTAQDVAKQQAQIAQLHARVEQMNADWLLRLPLLGDLLGLPIPDNETTSAFDAQLRQEALTALTLELLQVGSAGKPYLLLVEDVHWIDESSQNILVALGRIIAETSILLLFVHRPQLGEQSQQNDQFLREIAELPAQTALVLDELSPEGSHALVQNRVQGPVAALALDLIYAQAQGNPFFTEELVDTLVESGRLAHQKGNWRLSPSMINALHAAGCLSRKDGDWVLAPEAALSNANLGVPDTVHGIVLSRLDRLPEAVKLTVKVASVIGRIFDFDLLAQAHPQAQIPDILLQQIGTLENRDFAQIEKPPPNHSYIFKHNITQEVVYGTLLDAQRKELHLRVAQTLEAQHPEEAERLAHHFYNSDLDKNDVRTKALDYLDAAGQRAKRDYANETALSYFDRALSLDARWQWLKDKAEVLHILGRRDEEKETLDALEQAENVAVFESAYLWGEYYESIGEYESAEGAIRRAMGDAEVRGDERGALRCQIQLADVALRQGDYNRAKERYVETMALVKEPAAEAEVCYGLGIVEREHGEYGEARDHLKNALVLNQYRNDRKGEAKALMSLGFIAFQQRIFDDAKKYYSNAQAIQHSIGDRLGEGISQLSLGQVILRQGDYGSAETLLLNALSIQKAVNNRWDEAIIWNELGVLYMMVGRWTEAQYSLDESFKICDDLGIEQGKAHILCNLGQIWLNQGLYAKAEACFNQGLFIADSLGEKLTQQQFLTELAIIKLELADYKQAIDFSERSQQLLIELGLDVLTTTDLTTSALAHIFTKNEQIALEQIQRAISILDHNRGNGPDFPQRDYFRCYQALSALNEFGIANHAFQLAYDLLIEKARKISDKSMRQSFLNHVQFNREIIHEAERRGVDSNDFGRLNVGT